MFFRKESHTYIGYAEVDASFAERLARDLVARGHEAWTTHFDTDPSGLGRAIERQGMMATARLYVLICPKVASQMVTAYELPFAIEHGITLIIVLHHEASDPSLLHSARQVDFRNGYDTGLDALDSALREELAKPDPRHHQQYGDRA